MKMIEPVSNAFEIIIKKKCDCLYDVFENWKDLSMIYQIADESFCQRNSALISLYLYWKEDSKELRKEYFRKVNDVHSIALQRYFKRIKRKNKKDIPHLYLSRIHYLRNFYKDPLLSAQENVVIKQALELLEEELAKYDAGFYKQNN